MTEYYLNTPLSNEDVRKLRIGDTVYLSGEIYLSRDEAHERALEYYKEGKSLPIPVKGLAVYHCGPVVRKINDKWEVVAAGPTTSTRMDIFEAEYIEKFEIKAVIGKGGMGQRTAEAMRKFCCVYLAFTGGAAVLAAKSMKVKELYWEDLGTPEAFWHFEVNNFGPMVVGIDSTGASLYETISQKALSNRKSVYHLIGIKNSD